MTDRPAAPLSEDCRRFLAAKTHLDLPPWGRVPSDLQRQFAHPWALAMALGRRLAAALPASALRFLAAHPRGHVVIALGPGRYEPGCAESPHAIRCGVAYLSAESVAQGGLELWTPLGQILDHLLGCHGEPEGPWLSDGGGITPRWQGVGRRFQRLFPLGHGVDELARCHPHLHLARSLAWQLTEPRRLEVADPLTYRLLRATLLSEPFWARAGAGQA